MAEIITPNDFEAQVLTGICVSSLPSALTALQKLLAFGPQHVVITSSNISLPLDLQSHPYITKFKGQHVLYLIASSKDSSPFIIPIPYIQGSFTGTGDLFSALLLANYDKCADLKSSCEKCVSILVAVLEETVRQESQELRIIDCRDLLVNPPCPLTSRAIDVVGSDYLE